MQPEDRAELESCGWAPRHALIALWCRSYKPMTMLIDGDVAACGGDESQLLDDVGRLWMFTTAAVERAPLAFVRAAHQQIRERLRIRSSLIVDVGETHHKALRLYTMLGFRIAGEPCKIGNGWYRRMSIGKE